MSLFDNKPRVSRGFFIFTLETDLFDMHGVVSPGMVRECQG